MALVLRTAGLRAASQIVHQARGPARTRVLSSFAQSRLFQQSALRTCSTVATSSSSASTSEAVASSPAMGAPEQTIQAPVRMRGGAVQKLKDMNAVLRLMVNSGGCSGYSYEFTLIDRPSENDIVVEQDGAQLVVDELSMSFLEDCEVDYVEEMIRSSFQVVKNKLADSKCGCGSSFSISF
mmetsp:Transcript_19774/g.46001  ORF Transcript_19774/g.46001 Transcript_19774/m.46001 type:complete len:181 (-) Transcript_19774:180-722(-)